MPFMLTTSRREFLHTLLTGAAGLTITWPAYGQGAAPPITATKLTDRLAVLAGAGGNVGLLIGRDGLLMIDGGLPDRAADMAKAVAAVSPQMVQVLFNTHYHFDHVGSNELLGRNKVRIIAHENVRKRLGERFDNPAFGRVFEALSPAGQPTETFAAGGKLAFGQDAIEYTHVPQSHTDGDGFVFFPAANVLHTGDLLFLGRYPVVDYGARGSLAGMAAALERMDRVGDAQTRVIPGHGPVSGKGEMRAAREMWLTINQRLEEHAKAGRLADEVVKAAPTKEFDAKLGVTDASGFVRQAYGGVLARRR
jgi:glyoxylase-like metal-dependent hydrolase (beta-lactamase superfamily II)